jgi:DNA-directed RNA polymerase sigma subunit (sigma70/sigma32)
MSFDNLKQDLQREKRNLDRDLAALRLIQQPEECFTLEQISQYTGYTRERIRCIEKAALRKLHTLLNDTLVQERFEPIR